MERTDIDLTSDKTLSVKENAADIDNKLLSQDPAGFITLIVIGVNGHSTFQHYRRINVKHIISFWDVKD